MARIVVEEQKEFAILPADSILHLKVDELEVRDVQGNHGPWQKLEFKFKILGVQIVGDGSSVDDYDSVISGPIWGSVPFRLTDSPENKLRQWSEAILGIELGVGFELDTDLFLNRECRGITTQYSKRAIDPKTQQPFKAHQVDSLLPLSGNIQAAQPLMQHPPLVQQPTVQQPAQQPAQQPVAAGTGYSFNTPPVPGAGEWGEGDDPPF